MTVPITVDWVTLAYSLPVVIGIAAAIVYLVTNAIKSGRFHRRVVHEKEFLRARVIVRYKDHGRWSRPYGERLGSRRMELVIRTHSIEVCYVGRPLGGIGGLNWYLDARSTTLVSPLTESNPFPKASYFLIETDDTGKPLTELALEVYAPDHQVMRALAWAGVRQDSAGSAHDEED